MSYDSLHQATQSLLDLIKANRLVLGEHMGANYLDQEIKKAQVALASCDDGTELNNEWLFVWYTGPGISQLVAMYPSMRSVDAFDFATSSVLGHYTIRRAHWTGGPLPKYDQTEVVG